MTALNGVGRRTATTFPRKRRDAGGGSHDRGLDFSTVLFVGWDRRICLRGLVRAAAFSRNCCIDHSMKNQQALVFRCVADVYRAAGVALLHHDDALANAERKLKIFGQTQK